VDNGAIDLVVTPSLAQSPDIQDQEIADLILEEGLGVPKGGPRSLSGYIIDRVPRRCEPGALALWRAPRAERRQTEISRLRFLIADPEFPEAEKAELCRQLKELEPKIQ
jgi:hypothetical protein